MISIYCVSTVAKTPTYKVEKNSSTVRDKCYPLAKVVLLHMYLGPSFMLNDINF